MDPQQTKKPRKKRDDWTPEEEEILRKAVEKHGEGDWVLVSTEVPNRGNKACMHRWNLRKEKLMEEKGASIFTDEEDLALAYSIGAMSTKWTKLNKIFTRHLTTCIQNRWHGFLKPKIEGAKTAAKKKAEAEVALVEGTTADSALALAEEVDTLVEGTASALADAQKETPTFTTEEDLAICNLFGAYRNWKTIAENLPHPEVTHLQNRWDKVLKAKVKVDLLNAKIEELTKEGEASRPTKFRRAGSGRGRGHVKSFVEACGNVNSLSNDFNFERSSSQMMNVYRAIRIRVVEELKSKGIDVYAHTWQRTHAANQLQESYKDLGRGKEAASQVSVAGRIVDHTTSGKCAFLTLRDDSGTIQLYWEKEKLLGDHCKHLETQFDIGDVLGAKGSVKRTKGGELSVCVTSFSILTKSLLPSPNVYYGPTDIYKQHRRRYVDMIANPGIADVLRKRAKIISTIRKTVESAGFIEVETPVAQAEAGGAEARAFITYHNSLGQDLYLRTSTELHLKRMLVGGLEKVYDIGRIFRNEGLSTRCDPKFTTIEMYEAYSTCESMMNMAEDVVTRSALEVNGTLIINYQGVEISLKRPWRRVTMHHLVKEATSIDFTIFGDDHTAAKEAALKTLSFGDTSSIEACPSVGHVLNEVFELVVGPSLLQPTFVLDYPLEVSPLAKPHRRHAGLTERFELFVCGGELANAFSELTDPLDQRKRLEDQVMRHKKNKAPMVSEEASKKGGDAYDENLDEDFLTALEYGMPPAYGMRILIDKLVMLMTNSASILDVIV